MSAPHFEFSGGTGHHWFLTPTYASLVQQAVRMSRRNAPVLVLGARGSRPEREALARTIHENSKRARAPFAKLSWEELSETYLESRLFGTGRRHPASETPGLIEQAADGCIYIEEIARFSLATQAKFVTLMQTGRYRPTEAPYEKSADVRFILASGLADTGDLPDDSIHPDLWSEVRSNVLVIPPLRRRRAEIVQMAEQYVHDYTAQTERHPPIIADDARDALTNYAWPKNTEELALATKHAIESTTGDTIQVDHLPPELAEQIRPDSIPEHGLRETLARIERDLIVRALETSRGNQTRAAKALGISERLMGLRVRKYDLDPKSYRTKT